MKVTAIGQFDVDDVRRSRISDLREHELRTREVFDLVELQIKLKVLSLPTRGDPCKNKYPLKYEEL